MTNDQTVFIVEDDPSMCASIVADVRTMGMRSEVYQSAENFLAAFNESRDGCIITDVRLPGISGLQLLESLTHRPRRPPAILITAFGDVRLAVRAMTLGALTILEKPYGEKELWDAIHKALALNKRQRGEELRLRTVQERLESLTVDERRALELILAGKTNKGIAQEMRSGLRTIEARRHSLMTKMGTQSLAELVRMVWETQTMVHSMGSGFEGSSP